jgi:glycosyltransferase involved in cell wall biosynthesis
MVYHGRDPSFDAPPRTPGQDSQDIPPLPFPYILSVGSLLPYRRAEDIIEALSHLSPLIHDLHFVYAGDSNERAYKGYLRQKVRGSAVADKIRFLGNVPSQSLPALYRGARCFVASTEIEACPNSVIEALASGCPIVASNTPPLPEILRDSAMFYEPRNSSELGSAIGKVVTDSKLSERLSHSSWERARHFSWDACAKSTAKALLDW